MAEAAELYWFLNSSVTIVVAQADNLDRISILHHRLSFNDAPPWHVHRDEDEIFQVLEGTVRFKLADKVLVLDAGGTIFLPRGVPHGFRVLSERGAQLNTITRGGFETMVRQASRPATHAGLPEPTSLTPELQAFFAKICAANGIDLIGPPID